MRKCLPAIIVLGIVIAWNVPLMGKASKVGKILFDEYHQEHGTLSAERAKTLSPEHPEGFFFGCFKSEVAKKYTLRRSVQPLTYDLLKSYNVLILAAPNQRLTSKEIDNVLKFAEKETAC